MVCWSFFGNAAGQHRKALEGDPILTGGSYLKRRNEDKTWQLFSAVRE
jgi:hypothetical protein